MHVRCTLSAILLACAAACLPPAATRVAASVDTRTPSAVITRDFARFVFPHQRQSPWVKPAPSEHYPGESAFYAWSIDWRVRAVGVDPQQIIVSRRWPTLHPPDGPLSEIVREAEVEVGTLCIPCEPTALTISRDSVFRAPALTAQMLDGAVIVTVTGRAAVSRLFRHRPDSVWFSISAPDGRTDDVTVHVKKR